MHSSSSNGSPRLRKKLIDFRARPNGNTRPEEGRRRNTGGVTNLNPIWPTAKDALRRTIRRKRSRSGASGQTHLAFMIWEATSISGSMIVGTATIRVHRSTAQHGSTRTAPRTLFDQDLGRMTQATFDPQVATIMILGCGIQPTACASPPRPKEPCHA
jgi:hypothetical protein